MRNAVHLRKNAATPLPGSRRFFAPQIASSGDFEWVVPSVALKKEQKTDTRAPGIGLSELAVVH